MFAPDAFKQNAREYLSTANDNVMICVQIESRKAVENVEEIASVDGIGKIPSPRVMWVTNRIKNTDMLFIGPNDLASSMGYFAFDHASIPEVQEATKRVLKAALDAGKFAGHFALTGDIGSYLPCFNEF